LRGSARRRHVSGRTCGGSTTTCLATARRASARSVFTAVGPDGCECIRAALERLSYACKRRVCRGASLHELREGRDGDSSTFARCAVGDCLENRITDTSFDGVGTDGEIRIRQRLMTFHRLRGAFERGFPTFNRHGNAIERHTLCLPFRHLAFQQTHGNTLAARARKGGVDPLLSALPALCKCGKRARHQYGRYHDG
jgi:hypothetical protein